MPKSPNLHGPRIHARDGDGFVGYFVPGRIEVLGKHTDYAGGASITCATRRGFRIRARSGAVAADSPGTGFSGEPAGGMVAHPDSGPRADAPSGTVSVRTTDGAISATLPIDPEVHVEGWANYVATVIRRVARNAPGALLSAELVFDSDLPQAAGMSSSSAFMIAVFLGLDGASGGRVKSSLSDTVDSVERLAGYLACVENGASFGRLVGERGVGTQGGSQDHTAILCSQEDNLRRYRYAPFAVEGTWRMPAGTSFVIASSGVVAEKTGRAREAYNAASALAGGATRVWTDATGMPARHLGDILAVDADASRTVQRAAEQMGEGGRNHAARLVGRVRAFEVEMQAVEAASRALSAADIPAFCDAVAASQDAAERLLGNQIPPTMHLAASASRCGALAASSFGAGFGGSVWALVPTGESDRFISSWRSDYERAFPSQASAAVFVVESPGGPAAGDDGSAAW